MAWYIATIFQFAAFLLPLFAGQDQGGLCPTGLGSIRATPEPKEIKWPPNSSPVPYKKYCQWRIIALNSHVNITVEDYDFKKQSCDENYLEIYDNGLRAKYRLVKICDGSGNQRVFYTSSDTAIIRFKPNPPNSLTEFQLRYQSVS